MNLLKRLAAVLALSLTLVALAPLATSPANAHTGFTWCESTNDGGEIGGHGCWRDDGDDWAACDEDSGDGMFAYAEFRVLRSGSWVLIGSADDGDDAGCDYGVEVNVLEGQKFRLRICLKSSPNSTPVSCDMRESEE